MSRNSLPDINKNAKVVPDEWPVPVVPDRIKKPEWFKGLLVAANVAREEDGTPIFGKVNPEAVLEMQEKRLCQLCGKRIALNDWCVFIGSTMLYKYQEAPLHVECARYSSLVCPRLRGGAADIEFTLCKKYKIVEFEPPLWQDPGVIPLPPTKRSGSWLGLTFAHNLVMGSDMKYQCLTCKSQQQNRMSYNEFLRWTK
jgi:hypothetical protein